MQIREAGGILEVLELAQVREEGRKGRSQIGAPHRTISDKNSGGGDGTDSDKS